MRSSTSHIQPSCGGEQQYITGWSISAPWSGVTPIPQGTEILRENMYKETHFRWCFEMAIILQHSSCISCISLCDLPRLTFWMPTVINEASNPAPNGCKLQEMLITLIFSNQNITTLLITTVLLLNTRAFPLETWVLWSSEEVNTLMGQSTHAWGRRSPA